MNAPCGWPQAQRFTCIKVNKQKSIAGRNCSQAGWVGGSGEKGREQDGGEAHLSQSQLKPSTSIVCQPQTKQTELTLLTLAAHGSPKKLSPIDGQIHWDKGIKKGFKCDF